jgi:hypothetical protein
MNRIRPPNIRRQADAVFTVSSGNREKILSILLILSKVFNKIRIHSF